MNLQEKLEELKLKSEQLNTQEAEINDKKAKLEFALTMQQTYLNTFVDVFVMGTDGWFVCYGEVAPYSKGYYINSRQNGVCVWGKENENIHTYKREYKAAFTELALYLIEYLVLERGWAVDEFEELKERVNEDFEQFPTIDDTSEPITHDSGRASHIANGYEQENLVQIIKGDAQGDYYSMTLTSQNDLARWLVATKFNKLDLLVEYGWDCSNVNRENLEFAKEIQARHSH